MELIILSVNVCCRTYIVKVPEDFLKTARKNHPLKCEGGGGVGEGVDFDNYSLRDDIH